MTATGQGVKQPLRAHLVELRNSLFVVGAIAVIASTLGYAYRDVVFTILMSPLDGRQLSYLTVGGGFQFVFQVMLWCGAIAALPAAIFYMYRFIAPALPEPARGRSVFVLITSMVLLVVGALFGYFIAIPGAIQFLLGFANDYVQSVLTADSYLGFFFAYTFGLGLLFQVPLVLLLVNWVRPLGGMQLLKFERYVVVIAFILAALITPTPDVVNQLIVALPVIVMYQLGFFAVLWVNKKQARQKVRASDTLIVS